tara:strand:- start:4112 stop:4228 length:117 start_codon:yes stop_codon:yes gene_type:complete
MTQIYANATRLIIALAEGNAVARAWVKTVVTTIKMTGR